MTEDHYATLGVAPRSEAPAIRAAYLALMRRYHPDKNDSPEALDRAHAIIAAFAVIGDAEQRLHYDWGRRRAAEAAAEVPRSWPGKIPRALVAAAVALLVLVPLSLMRFPEPPRAPLAGPTARVAEVANVATHLPNKNVAPPAVAAPVPAPTPVAPVAPITITPPAAPVALVASRLVKPEAAPPRPKMAEAALVVAPAPRKLARREPPPAGKQGAPKTPTVSASAKCRLVKPGAETAICNSDKLAALDRNAVAFYNQSLMYGAAAKRGALLDSRNNFLARREACRSDACLQSVHLGHLRELSAIVEKPSSAPPL